jgi:hypothetical protein
VAICAPFSVERVCLSHMAKFFLVSFSVTGRKPRGENAANGAEEEEGNTMF